MLEILPTQRKHIENTVIKDREGGQMRLGFPEDETRQLEANRRYWDKRLDTLQDEIRTEPGRIREVYDVRATRIERRERRRPGGTSIPLTTVKRLAEIPMPGTPGNRSATGASSTRKSPDPSGTPGNRSVTGASSGT